MLLLAFARGLPGSGADTSLQWTAGDLPATASATGGRVTLDDKGAAALDALLRDIPTAQFRVLSLTLERPAPGLRVSVTWTASDGVGHRHELVLRPRRSQLIDLGELPGWQGTASTLGLAFNGPPRGSVDVRSITLWPHTPTTRLRTLISDRTGFAPWHAGAINTFTGVVKTSPMYPTLLAAGWLAASLAVLGAIALWRRWPPATACRGAALAFLASWLALDLGWQSRLWQQVTETREQFAGKTLPEKLAIGPDAALYAFVTEAASLVTPGDARVFVAAGDDDYSGMRGAYYLYPLNAYWRIGRVELPAPDQLRSGDYVLLLPGARSRFEHTTAGATPGLLQSSRGALPAEQLLARQGRTLLWVR